MPLPPSPWPSPPLWGEGAPRAGEGGTSWPSYYLLKLSKTMKGVGTASVPWGMSLRLPSRYSPTGTSPRADGPLPAPRGNRSPQSFDYRARLRVTCNETVILTRNFTGYRVPDVL
jgi:hypothetical protein